MERSVRIEHFRNIGFSRKLNNQYKQDYERLVINNSLNHNELGDLIIIIGDNNTGKSNYLDALKILGGQDFQEKDKTDLFLNESSQNPSIILFGRRDEDEVDYCSYKKDMMWGENISPPDYRLIMEQDYFFCKMENIKEELYILHKAECDYLCKEGSISDIYNKVINNELDRLEKILPQVFKILDQYHNGHRHIFYEERNDAGFIFNKIKDTNLFREYSFKSKKYNNRFLIEENYKHNHGYPFLPKIITYINKDISSNDLICNIDELGNSEFFKSIFNSIDSFYEINNAYERYKNSQNKGILKQEEKIINEKLNKLSEKFNQFCHIDKSEYRFEIDMESSKIQLLIFSGSQTRTLENQSTGFRWYFNLFFNLLNRKELETGDIVIMDEPATNLNVKGQRMIRNSLKEFAIHNNISIIMATHSPFLIDIDYLDELRIVTNKENISTISNNFAAVDLDVPDYLLPIRESLTVENHILLKPEETVVFVEGITDYNYLVAFKKLLGIEHISFLPINGVGKTKEERCEISKQLIKIRKDAILLVDNDKAGQSMKALNGDSDLKVITLSDIDPSFKEIESLFSSDDLEMYNLYKKNYSKSIIFKNKIIYKDGKISDQTKDNFKKVFDKLKEETE